MQAAPEHEAHKTCLCRSTAHLAMVHKGIHILDLVQGDGVDADFGRLAAAGGDTAAGAAPAASGARGCSIPAIPPRLQNTRRRHSLRPYEAQSGPERKSVPSRTQLTSVTQPANNRICSALDVGDALRLSDDDAFCPFCRRCFFVRTLLAATTSDPARREYMVE